MEYYKIYVPSYRRAKLCIIHKYLPEITYVVKRTEKKNYLEVHDKIITAPDEAQGNLCRIKNWMLGHLQDGCEWLVMMDDDIDYFQRYECNKRQKLDKEGVEKMLMMGCVMADDMGAKFWGVNIMLDKRQYNEHTPFSTTKYIGGPFTAHKEHGCKYDERLSLKDDYDITLQILNRHRLALRLNMYSYHCRQANMAGGISSYRSVQNDLDQNKMLQKKWGSKIVRFDYGQSSRSNKIKTFDINPIIHAPIKGI